MPNTPYRAAVIQAAPAALDLHGTLERVDQLTARAAADGAALVVFPEAFVGGYPKGVDFGVKLGTRSDAGRAASTSRDCPCPSASGAGGVVALGDSASDLAACLAQRPGLLARPAKSIPAVS